jgi:two-component system, OmpR family, phosphate regulon response regulator OmpR
MDNFLAHILVVDDDEGIRSLVKKYLSENKYIVNTAESAEDASKKIKIIKFDLIILDIMMPGKSGLEFIQENRKKLDTPIILLTAKGQANERVEGLELGADDYLAKPFEPKELILRIKNILSKTRRNDLKRVIQFENIKIDLNKQLIFKNNLEHKINNTEKIILEKMINNPGKIFERMEIGRLIDLNKERSIDVIITRLRKKIELNPKNPKFLQTIRGAGYVLWIE